MSRKRTDRFGPDRPDARKLARRQRNWSLFATWIFILVFFVAPIGFGNSIFVVPTVIFGLLNMSTMRLARGPWSPESQTLTRGELQAATRAKPVEVRGTWSPGARVRGEPARKGSLTYDGKRLRFKVGDKEFRFDAPIDKITLAGPPTFMRPQLDLNIGGVMHSVRFFAMWDLGATFVGPTVAGEWYAQLRELGAS